MFAADQHRKDNEQEFHWIFGTFCLPPMARFSYEGEGSTPFYFLPTS